MFIYVAQAILRFSREGPKFTHELIIIHVFQLDQCMKDLDMDHDEIQLVRENGYVLRSSVGDPLAVRGSRFGP